MAVRIVTDSACSVSVDERQRLSISRVPLHVHAAGDEIPLAEQEAPSFFDQLADMESLPTTSQPTPGEFITIFRRILSEGHDVLAVLISGGLSGTVDSALSAIKTIRQETPAARIEVVDSRSNSLQEGYAVLSAAEAAHGGASLETCRQAALETIRRTRFLFTPHTLDYLRRGGRITGASALLSVMLKIAPILTAENGETGIASVARGARSARQKVVSLMRKDVARFGLRRAAVQYIADAEEALRFAKEAIEPIVGAAVPIVPIPAVVGLHVGPAVGVVYETVEPMRD
jgi:DegV family protein with EDD domain